MKFGFDIDDTLINLREHGFHIYNQKLNQTVAIEQFHKLKTLEIHSIFGLSDEEGYEMWKDSLEEIYFTDCPPFSGVIDLLQQLTEQGHEIYYITARKPAYCEQTKQWLIDNGFPVKNDHFYCGMKDEEKVQIIKELQLDFYFDDKPEVLNTLLEETVKCFVKDQSYNQHIKLPRFKDWSKLELQLLEKNVI
ncbi:5' nucleotidase, NT5C type [Cytobacillus purgationiresistens]|uniref:Nucleotidase n=1 Tax=Cytobacillus purgationiresistens TaxID=863449 RepID=A0ABU0AKF5_9BACI|nr:HAD hydrolase-like protein [Cytobacillus purgationiresistens]MDQ0270530.1 putative HAD superfamily protein [Cytobacillus purgationiresistens]